MKILLSPFHDNLYPNQWIIFRLSNIPFGWKIILTLSIGLTFIPSSVLSRDVDYYYNHRAYRRNVLPNLIRNQEQPLVVEPTVDDYTVDNNYEKTQFKLRSSAAAGGGDGDDLISGLGLAKDNGGYTFGLDDTYSSSLRALNTDSNENLDRQQPQADDQNVPLSVSSYVKNTPKPSSQLKASSFNVDSSPPMTMFARASASASARIHGHEEESVENLYFVGSVIGATFVGIFLVVAAGYFVHRVNVQRRAAADVEYPAYGVVGPGASLKEKESSAGKSGTSGTSKPSTSGTVSGSGALSPSGDRRLAQSAQMYHYHHQKQQMISSDKVATEAGQRPSTSEMDSEEEENEEGDYTVYECPGLASTGEMEVKNPLFQDDITPISSPSVRDIKQDGKPMN